MRALVPLLIAVAAGAADTVTYAQIAPILEARCVRCHGPDKVKAGLRLDSHAAIMAGGRGDPAVVPGKPDESPLLVLAAKPADDEERMPPKGEPMTADELALVRAWIQAGAPAAP
jgi:mono/diheme cytochrome c family protein